jgi:hypothetical protein
MKKFLSFLLLLFLSSGLSSCLFQEVLVESDYSYRGNFDTYKTYNFLGNELQPLPNGFPADELKEAIKKRMDLMGYRYSETMPDLLVSYQLFEGELTFRGYSQKAENEFMAMRKRDQEHEKYKPVNYNLDKGTLLVLLFDRHNDASVWQGYASGVFNSETLADSRFVNYTVRSIFDRFRFFAEGFNVRNKS